MQTVVSVESWNEWMRWTRPSTESQVISSGTGPADNASNVVVRPMIVIEVP
jgi:hypothetical protein